MTRCNGCHKAVGGGLKDTIVLTNTPESFAVFTIRNFGDQAVFIADTGNAIGRCNGCVINATTGDFMFAQGGNGDNPFAKFTLKKLANQRYSMMGDNGKYVSRCQGCAPGSPAAANQSVVFSSNNSNSDFSQWNIIPLNNSPAQSKSRLLQVLYVIPNGQTARPDADRAIREIMTIIQRHYQKQLGITFGLKSPLVTTVNIQEDASYAVNWDNNVKLVKTRLTDDYVNNENVVFTIIEGTTGDAGGSWNIVKMTGGFWDTAYKTYKQTPKDLPNQLHGWAHELGHAFGLLHTSDAKPCFARSGIDLGTLPSLIMQKSGDMGSIYNYPFLGQEKKLLLDSSYIPGCRPFLSESGAPARPHASLHLRYFLP